MESYPIKQPIIIEKIFENCDIENELLRSTPYELLVINGSTDELLSSYSSMPVAIISFCIPITAQMVSEMPSSIKVVSHPAAGYDKIDIKACRERNIQVCYVSDYGTDTVADHAVALVFAAQRRLVTFHKLITEKHEWNYQAAGKLRNLNTMTLGIIGYGRIGTSFANKIRPFVKEILIHTSKSATTSTIKDILERCDIISLHIPYSTANHHLISFESIAQMKRRPILINVSRGKLIDTKALVQALKSGQISYAALDVLENEPLIDEELTQLDNVLLTPHVAWYSVEAEHSLRRKAIEDVLRVLIGKEPLYPVPE